MSSEDDLKAELPNYGEKHKLQQAPTSPASFWQRSSMSGMVWLMLVIPILERLRQEGCHEFEDSMSYIVKSRLAWAIE